MQLCEELLGTNWNPNSILVETRKSCRENQENATIAVCNGNNNYHVLEHLDKEECIII
jgi:hypothetical protein